MREAGLRAQGREAADERIGAKDQSKGNQG